MSTERPSRGARRVLAATLAVASTVIVLLVIALMLGSTFSWRLLGIRIRLNTISTALAVGSVLAAALLLQAWHSRVIRRLAVALLVGFGLLTLIAVARQAQPYVPVGDLAVIESDTMQAAQGRLLLGPYSRFGWHHPGPMYFYLLAPFHLLGGRRTAALAAGALAINLASVAAIAWIAMREANGALGVAMTAACLLFAARFSDALASSWNPHVLVLPVLALVAVSAAIAGGRPGLLPLAALFATFAAQTHVGLVPAAVAIPTLAASASAARAIRRGDRLGRERVQWTMNGTLWVLMLLWFLPIAEQATRTPGNLTSLWTFFVAGGQTAQRFDVAFLTWADALTGSVRPAFSTAWGGAAAGRAGAWTSVLAVGEIVLLALGAAHAFRRRQAFRGALAALLATASLVALWSTARIQGDIVDHEVFWMAGLGAMNAAVLVERAIAGLWRRPLSVPRLAVPVTCGALCAAAAIVGVRQLQAATLRSLRPGEEESVAAVLADAVQRHVRDEHVEKILIRVDGPAWGVAAGVVVELQKARVPFAVEPGAVFMYGDGIAARGDETGALVVATAARHRQLAGEPGVVPLAARKDFFVDVLPAPRKRIR